jgi:DNA invertase Pin-like site-specific DNA recombinase
MLYGYARVSTIDRDLGIQEATLKAAGCEVIRSEKVSGTSTAGRQELATMLEFIRKGDALVLTRIDRLACSIGDLQDIVRTLKAKGATLKATEQPIDTSTAAGKAFLDILGVFAEFETNLRRERQLEGIAKAKAAGVYKGRKPTRARGDRGPRGARARGDRDCQAAGHRSRASSAGGLRRRGRGSEEMNAPELTGRCSRTSSDPLAWRHALVPRRCQERWFSTA